MVNNQTLDNTLDFILEKNQQTLENNEQDSFSPMFACFSEVDSEGEREMIFMLASNSIRKPDEDANDRSRLAFRLGERLAEEVPDFNLEMVFTMWEAWMAKESSVMPRNNPDRKEVLITIGSSTDGRQVGAQQPITRVGNNRMVLEEAINKVYSESEFTLEGNLVSQFINGFLMRRANHAHL